ncbi:MAG: phosphatase PAP2 family protein [Prevotella sp.]|nr:phosphatase PAP2 family protein [Prevotella sp.]
METLIELDKQLLLTLNGSESLYYDMLMRTLTNAWTWVPLYISLFYIVLKNNENVQKILLVVACAGLCVLLAGTVDDAIVKPLVARWRPTHDPQIGLSVDIVDGYRGGRYGFFSAHASNTFSIAIFFCWLVRSRLLSLALVLWSLLNCWTRLYLGVHYPGDILVGLTWGAIVGSIVYYVYRRSSRRFSTGMSFTSTHYTSTGYERSDADVPVSVLVLTLLYALIRAAL